MFTRIINCFIILIVATVSVCLLLPSLDGDREPFDRMSCSGHLKRITLALHNYHDRWGCFPPAITYDGEQRPMHSWRVLILPYLDDPPTALYADYDMSEPWNGLNNSQLLEAMPEVFRCASARFKERNSPETYGAVACGGRRHDAGRPNRCCHLFDCAPGGERPLE